VRPTAVAVALLVLSAACAGGTATERTPDAREPAPDATTTTTRSPSERQDGPAAVAEQYAAAAEVLADPRSTPAELDDAGHRQQLAVRALVGHREWDADVASRLPAPLRAAIALDAGAGRELAALVRRPQPTLPAWRIAAPPPVAELRRHYAAGEAATGVPWQYLAAVHLVETRMSRIDGRSSAGAEGPMQFLPGTWAAYGTGDIHDDGDAILAAARFLAAHGAPSDLPGALYRYNPTIRYVRAVTAYAERMRADEGALLGYHGWEVHYATTLGDVWLRPGYDEASPRPVTPADVTG
jgi:hypothetical protein